MHSPAPVAPVPVLVDVTDTLATPWRAGIQRVVLQLVARLGDDERLDVQPVVWLESTRSFRRLATKEAERLDPAAPPAGSARQVGGSTSTSGARDLLARVRTAVGRVRRAVVRFVAMAGLEPGLRRVRRWVLSRTRDRQLVPLSLDPPAGAVLLEMDTVWNNTLVDRDDLYRELHARGVRVAAVVYDLLPQTHPEWFEAPLVEVSDRTIAAQARHADALLAISEHTRAELLAWAGERGIDPVDPVVVPLGADGAGRVGASDGAQEDELPDGVEPGRYVLVVGTIEPRKNHAVLLDAFERWSADHPDLHLVVVGRPGWNDDDVVARLEAMSSSSRTRERLHWRRDAGDGELAALYRHALVVAVPAVTEGYGLPVIEALAHGTPVVSSTGGALPEAGGDRVDTADPHDVDAWVAAVTRHVDDPAHHDRRVAEAAEFRPPRWSDTARVVAEQLLRI